MSHHAITSDPPLNTNQFFVVKVNSRGRGLMHPMALKELTMKGKWYDLIPIQLRTATFSILQKRVRGVLSEKLGGAASFLKPLLYL